MAVQNCVYEDALENTQKNYVKSMRNRKVCLLFNLRTSLLVVFYLDLLLVFFQLYSMVQVRRDHSNINIDANEMLNSKKTN